MEIDRETVALKRAISCLRVAADILEKQEGKRVANQLRSLARMRDPENAKERVPDNLIEVPSSEE